MSKRQCMYRYIFGIGAAGLVAIGSISANNYFEREKDIQIYFVPKTDDPRFTFWETMHMGAILAAKELAVELTYIGPKNENSAKEQQVVVNYAVKQRPDSIIISPIDQEMLKESIEKAKKEGIEVVGVDSTMEQIKHSVVTNNVVAARTLMQHLGEMIGGSGTVAVLNFQADATTAIDREQGCREEAIKYEAIHLLPTVYVDGEIFAAYEAAKELLKKNPHINGFFCTNQYMTEGAYLAVSELELVGKVKVVGFDSSRLIIEGIEKGGIEGVLVQKPFNMGYMSVRTAVDILKGKKEPEKIEVDYKFITKQVMYETENQKLIYPIVK